MKIAVKVKLKAKKALVTQIDANHFEIAVTAPPVQGKANAAAIKALARHLGIPQNKIQILSGHTQKQKVFVIT